MLLLLWNYQVDTGLLTFCRWFGGWGRGVCVETGLQTGSLSVTSLLNSYLHWLHVGEKRLTCNSFHCRPVCPLSCLSSLLALLPSQVACRRVSWRVSVHLFLYLRACTAAFRQDRTTSSRYRGVVYVDVYFLPSKDKLSLNYITRF